MARAGMNVTDVIASPMPTQRLLGAAPLADHPRRLKHDGRRQRQEKSSQ